MKPVLQEKWRHNFNGDLWLLVVFQHDAIELLDMEKVSWDKNVDQKQLNDKQYLAIDMI